MDGASSPARTADVADWAAGVESTDIPPAVRGRALDLLLDTLGVGIAAGRTPAAAIAYDLACSQFAAGDATAHLPFDGRTVSPAGAAYAFATRIDNLDGHDGYQPAKGHAGVALVAGLLAVGESHGTSISGRNALTALIIGYEIACRSAVALHGSAGDYHSSGAWNALGVATLAARLRGFDSGRLAAALGIAEYHAPRAPMMREIDSPSMLHDSSGWGALAGVTGADLAARGFAASPAALPGIGDSWSSLGEEWLLLDQYVKPHPVCFWAQPAITAALQLRERHGVDPACIASVRIDTFDEATRLYAGVPENTQTAQYALAFPVAAALVHGRLGPAEVTSPGLEDPAVAALTGQVEVRSNESFSRRFPEQRLAAVSIRLTDGTECASGPTEPRGTPGQPMDRAAIEQKFTAYAEPMLGADRTRSLRDCVYGFDTGEGSLADLIALSVSPAHADND
jgi:2-methylcitrate dehydratase PrpD